jgi:hypothetical protein
VFWWSTSTAMLRGAGTPASGRRLRRRLRDRPSALGSA